MHKISKLIYLRIFRVICKEIYNKYLYCLEYPMLQRFSLPLLNFIEAYPSYNYIASGLAWNFLNFGGNITSLF